MTTRENKIDDAQSVTDRRLVGLLDGSTRAQGGFSSDSSVGFRISGGLIREKFSWQVVLPTECAEKQSTEHSDI